MLKRVLSSHKAQVTGDESTAPAFVARSIQKILGALGKSGRGGARKDTPRPTGATRSLLWKTARLAAPALDRSRPGDLVVLCVDKHAQVMERLEQRTKVATPRGDNEQDGRAYDPDFVLDKDAAEAETA